MTRARSSAPCDSARASARCAARPAAEASSRGPTRGTLRSRSGSRRGGARLAEIDLVPCIGTTEAAIGRGAAARALPRVEEAHDWPAIASALAEERPGSDGRLVLVVEDGVPYQDAIRGLDLAKETGFERTALGAP